ncbi:hypothetical protein OJF2_48630 [Aquisphaera giovannonii]|uniref:Uncharacterized protein n=1 Tax=Aquisphaera giovannonii TaxID=406548 RepID=A0A5B9W6M0_9BACT|nr:hypothetical protein [Aquisphaera giovannonii]QEH36302.1 hypothetical protein OJF2_48630 [Aquisphaera giovannonii]
MNLDIRLPIGLLFAILGGLLIVYGLWTQFSDPNMYDRSLGLNINLWWGLVMSLFGTFMTWLGRKGATEKPQQAH